MLAQNAPKLILHIGMQKTGTSSLQVMLNASKAPLREVGFVFPDLPSRDERVWTSPFRHNIVAATYSDFPTTFSKMTPAEQSEFWGRLAEGPLTPILSAEEFSRQGNFELLAKPLAPFATSVVVYLRRQDLFCESLYNQRNKILVQNISDRVLSPDLLSEASLFEFLRAENYIRLLNYEKLLARIEAQLRPARVIVRIFSRDKMLGGDVCQDFANVLGINPAQLNMPTVMANESIANAELQKLVDIVVKEGQEAARLTLAETATKLQRGELVKGSYALLSPITRRHLMQQYAEINLALNEKYRVSFS